MKRVLLTGGTGFVGANLAHRLLREGYEVHLLLRREHNPWRIEAIRSALSLHVVDLAAAESVVAAVARIRPEWIFHLAAYGAYSTQTKLDEMVRTNIVGTVNLVNACLGVGFEAFVNTGSSSEYGFKDHAPNEAELIEPNSHYAVTKASATLFCRYTAQAHKVHLPTLRLYSVYGPYEEPSRLIPKLITEGLRGRFPPLVSPDIARDYVHVDDVCEAYLAAARSGGELGAIFNVGSGVQTSLRCVVDTARRTMQIPGAPIWGSMLDRAWDTDRWVSDCSKIKRNLGWKSDLTFEQGFALTLEWFRQNSKLYGIE